MFSGIKMAMWKWVPLLVCLFMAHTVAVESFDRGCSKDTAHGVSCAVPCHNHNVLPLTGSATKPMDLSFNHVPVSGPLFAKNLFDKSLFRPPKVSAK